ncbi:MAG: TIGR00268 family protein, partial [Lachnospiraceae bacterium]|nr:TIGR00268 family protein [Lachnospiraceae bacterium]
LASRFVYGETITEEKLRMVEQAEQYLMDRGFRQVRVRVHGTLARIEVPVDAFDRIARQDVRDEITRTFASYGFTYVAVDLQGYQTGNMNKTLENRL